MSRFPDMHSADWFEVGLRRKDISLLNRLCLELNGFEHKSEGAQRAMAANVSARMHSLGKTTLPAYLESVEASSEELSVLVSLLTIHTTSWFRERPHFGLFTKYVSEWLEANQGAVFRLLSAGCSTGEEPYTFALALEHLRSKGPAFDYQVTGFDVDPLSVQAARRATYHGRGLNDIDAGYQRFLQPGDTPTEFRPARSVRDACQFVVASIVDPLSFGEAKFDAVVCRNVLIYLDEKKRSLAVSQLMRALKPGGLLTLGLSDALPLGIEGMRSLGTTSYIRTRAPVIADLPSVALHEQERLMSIPPVAQAEGDAAHHHFDVLLVGASTGGIEALQRLLLDLPPSFPPTIVVQHIDANYVDDLVALLVKASGLDGGRVAPGAELARGRVYVAPAHRHIEVRQHQGRLFVHLSDKPPIGGHRPSVTALFDSALPIAERTVACLLTGMGADGAESLAALKRKGAYTLAQDAGSSVVYGMPKRAIELGGACFVGNPWQMRVRLLHLVRKLPTSLSR